MRSMFATLALLAAAVTALPVLAQSPAGGEIPESISTPPLGVQRELDRGFFADLRLGTFFALNGTEGASPVSTAEPFLGLALGYDVTDRIVAGLSLGYGAAAEACFVAQPEGATGCEGGAGSFSVLTAGAFAGYLHPMTYQWYLGAKVTGGMAMMSPGPVDDPADPGASATGWFGGALLSTEYHTHLDHFVVGADAGVHYLNAGTVSFPGVVVYPYLKYVF